MNNAQDNVFLNEFEKKSLLIALKDFDLIDLGFYVNQGRTFCTMFYRRAGFIFAEYLMFSNGYSIDKRDIDDFIKKAKYLLNDQCTLLDFHFLNNTECDSAEKINIRATYLAHTVMSQQNNYLEFDLIDKELILSSFTNVYVDIFERLFAGESLNDVFASYLLGLGISEEKVICEFSNL